jgi:hypothetical protein
MPKAKPYSGTVDADLAAQVLNATGVKDGELLLGDALRAATENLKRLVKCANLELKDNEFAKIVADHLSMKMNRRGGAALAVSEVGKVFLCVSYDEEDQPVPAPVPLRLSTVPLMKELKARASRLGVDISRFGIKRKLIHEFLEGMASSPTSGKTESSRQPRPAKARPAVAKPAAAPPSVVKVAQDPVEPDPGPMSSRSDETTVSSPPETLPPRPPPIVKPQAQEVQEGPVLVDTGVTPIPSAPKPAKSQGDPPKRTSLRQLATEAKDFDIADLLASETPK